VAVEGTLEFSGSNSSSRVLLEDGTSLSGVVNMTAGFGVLGFNQTGTLAGPLTVNMDTDTFFVGSSYLTIEGENTVTLGSGVTVRGQGQVGSQYHFGGTNALINQGLISADTSDAPGARTLSIFGSSFTNEGTARAINGGALALQATVQTNSGLLEVLAGSTATVASGITNYNSTTQTLTGGTWEVVGGAAGAATLDLPGNIAVNAANILLSGGNSSFTRINGLVQNTGTFRLAEGRDFTTSSAFSNTGTIWLTGTATDFNAAAAFGNSGTIELAGGRVAALTLTNSGTIAGFGTITFRPTNSGTIRASGGLLSLFQGIQGGSGTVQIDPGGSLDLSAGNSNSSADFLIHNGATSNSLNLGTHSFTVTRDYTNANFGTGNAFNPRANISNSGLILAGGNTAQQITGNVTGGTTATPGLVLPNIHESESVSRSFAIGNTGSLSDSPALRGALQIGANGTITDARLSGSGVTARTSARSRWCAERETSP
jgi:hypothetical protein